MLWKTIWKTIKNADEVFINRDPKIHLINFAHIHRKQSSIVVDGGGDDKMSTLE